MGNEKGIHLFFILHQFHLPSKNMFRIPMLTTLDDSCAKHLNKPTKYTDSLKQNNGIKFLLSQMEECTHAILTIYNYIFRNGNLSFHLRIYMLWKQPKCPLREEWIKKMWHIYTMEYYSIIKRNENELSVVTWMDLESVIQSEVSQKEKNKYCMLTYIYGI